MGCIARLHGFQPCNSKGDSSGPKYLPPQYGQNSARRRHAALHLSYPQYGFDAHKVIRQQRISAALKLHGVSPDTVKFSDPFAEYISKKVPNCYKEEHMLSS